MQRRLVLTGALALVAAPALAQSNPAPPTDAPAAEAPKAPPVQAPAEAPAMKMAPPTTLSDGSAEYLKGMVALGSLSLAVSRLAALKVSQPALKQFVGFEIAEQETVASIIKGLMMPGAPPSGAIRGPTDAELAGNLDADGKALVARLHDMKAGAAFDRDYVKAQIEGHENLRGLQEAYLKAPSTTEETALAKLARGMILEHLALLADIAKRGG